MLLQRLFHTRSILSNIHTCHELSKVYQAEGSWDRLYFDASGNLYQLIGCKRYYLKKLVILNNLGRIKYAETFNLLTVH